MLLELSDISQVSMGTLTHLILRHLSGESSQVTRDTSQDSHIGQCGELFPMKKHS